MSFEQNLAEKTAYCEKVLIDMLPSVEGLTGTDRYASVVVDAMQYSVMAGGKRLRPLFIYETCLMYGLYSDLCFTCTLWNPVLLSMASDMRLSFL